MRVGIGIGIARHHGSAISLEGYKVNGIPPVLLLDFSAGTYGDNPVWWAEAPTQPADAVVYADFELGRYAA